MNLYAQSWTNLYVHSCKNSKESNIILFEKLNIPLFTQLICSWNGLRPAKGYFQFYAQVRNSGNKKWGKWHLMYDWGHNKNNSHQSKSDGDSYYEYTRLELENAKEADAFRIKVVAAEEADFKNLFSVAASCSNYTFFKEQNSQELKHLPSIFLSHAQPLAQLALDHPDKNRVCSPVSCCMLLNTLGYPSLPLDCVQHIYDNGLQVYGSWPFNTSYIVEASQGRLSAYVRRLEDFQQLYSKLCENIPVIVSVRGSLPGAQIIYSKGHLLMVIGWDKERQEVICMDPAFEDIDKVLMRYPVTDFLRAWETSRRLSYWISKAV